MDGNRLGPYLLRSELGSGGMATVWLATVVEESAGIPAGTEVAVKVVHPHLMVTPGFFERFLREIEVGKTIRHENVVRTLDARAVEGGEDGDSYLVMEYVEGQTLRGLLAELGWVPEDLCLHIGREITKALTAIHSAGIVHRDLKPENVLITDDNVVKVMDLGVALLTDEALRLSQAGQFVGSVFYASPEQFRGGGQDLDGRADLYSLGLTLYELSTGINPFRDESLAAVARRQLMEMPKPAAELNPQISPFFEEVVHRLVEKDREMRFPSAEDLLLVLEQGEASEWWRVRSVQIREETKKPLRRIRIPRETGIYGREKELARLREAWGLAHSGEGRVVLVDGEAGVGKTRLVDEFAAALQKEGEDFHFLFGSYPPAGAATPSGAFNAAYLEHLGGDGLEERLASYLTVTPRLVPAFAAFLRGEPPPKGEEPLTKESIQTVFVHLTRALAAEKPTIVLVDDLHFAPAEGRALFTALALALADHRILLVGTSRPGLSQDFKAELGRSERTTTIEVGRLSGPDLNMVLKDAFHSQSLVDRLGPLIGQKSDGNPFFVFEIIRGLREGQFVREDEDGTWVATQVITEIEIPSSVKDLVAARIADLAEEDRDLLDMASCCGFSFDPGLVGEALGLPRIPTLKRLGKMEKEHRLVRSAGRRYLFDHHQVREVLYEGLPELLREEYHAALGETLEQSTGAGETDPEDLDGPLAVDLAEHFLYGGRGERALRYLSPALIHLEQTYRNDRVVDLADRALRAAGLLSGGERVDVILRKAAPLALAGRREEHLAALMEAMTLADDLKDLRLRARVRRLLGVHHWTVSEHARAQERLREAIELAQAAGDRREEAAATGDLGNVFLRVGQNDAAKDLYERQFEIAREIGDRKEEGRATGNLGIVAFRTGDDAGAKEHYERYLEVARELGDRRGEGNAAGNLGIMAHSRGRLEEARGWVERQLAIAREIGDRRSESMASGTLGLVLKDLGRLPEAQEWHERQWSIAREIGDRRGEGIATGNMGILLKRMGRFEEARECHERHLRIVRAIGDKRGEGIALLNLGTTLEALGRLGEARTCYESRLALGKGAGDLGGQLVGLVNLGGLLVRMGDPQTARTRLEEAREQAVRLGVRAVEAAALRGLGEAAYVDEDPAKARELLQAALGVERETDSPEGLVESLLALGRFAKEEGRAGEAESLFREAVGVAADLDSPGPGVLARCLLASVVPAEEPEAREELEAAEILLEQGTRMEARYALHEAVGDEESAETACRILRLLVESVPREQERDMVEKVPLHRKLLGATGP